MFVEGLRIACLIYWEKKKSDRLWPFRETFTWKITTLIQQVKSYTFNICLLKAMS